MSSTPYTTRRKNAADILAAGIAHLEANGGTATNNELAEACGCGKTVWKSDCVINHNERLRAQRSPYRLSVEMRYADNGGAYLVWTLIQRNPKT